MRSQTMPLNKAQQTQLAKAYALHQRGRVAEARVTYDALLRVAPDDPQLLHLAGIAAEAAGNLEAARTLLGKAVSLAPTDAAALNNLGGVLKALGQLPAALEHYDRALKITPQFAEAHNNRATVLIALDRADEAIAGFDQAIALKPDYANAYRNRGEALLGLGRTSAALADFDRAIGMRPDFTAAHLNRGRALRTLGRQAEAATAFGRAATLNPTDPVSHFLRGAQLGLLKRYPDALICLDSALQSNPDFIEALVTRAGVLLYLDRPDDAIADCRRALALDPQSTVAHTNLGQAHRAMRQDNDALAAFRGASEIQPDYASGHWNAAVVLLQTQPFPAGWREHEWRWQVPDAPPRRNFTQPLWLGETDISGQILFVHWEQGLGDTIQFCRFAPIAAARGAKLVLSVQNPLRGLLSQLSPEIAMVGETETPAAFDCHIPMMSLPLALGTDGTAWFGGTPYLAADPALSDAWRDLLAHRPGRRIGIAWSGNATQDHDRNRSMALAHLRPVLREDIAWTVLQKDIRPADAAVLRQTLWIDDFSQRVTDFNDTAALIDAMELIITVDTSIAHLAGAMGKPVWLLACFNADWRWPRDDDRSTWYPTMRIFHQRAIGDWPELVTRVEAALAEWIAPLASTADL